MVAYGRWLSFCTATYCCDDSKGNHGWFAEIPLYTNSDIGSGCGISGLLKAANLAVKYGNATYYAPIKAGVSAACLNISGPNIVAGYVQAVYPQVRICWERSIQTYRDYTNIVCAYMYGCGTIPQNTCIQIGYGGWSNVAGIPACGVGVGGRSYQTGQSRVYLRVCFPQSYGASGYVELPIGNCCGTACFNVPQQAWKPV